MSRLTLFGICRLLAALLFVPGCRTFAPSPEQLGRPALTRRTTVPTLASVEIQSNRGGVENAYDAVMRFRPNFLVPRPSADGTRAVPVVYLDDTFLGGPNMLRSIPIDAIVEIRYFTVSAATTRFGPHNAGGVIDVRTRR